MSEAWKGDVVLSHTPASVVVGRLALRALAAVAWLVVGLVMAWTPLAILFWVFAGIAAAHTLLGVANVAKSHRAVLVLRSSGVIERTQSWQEVWLRRPVEWVQGATVEVSLELQTVYSSKADPRVTLTAGQRRIAVVPLYGTAVDEFVEDANAHTVPRGMRLVRVDPTVTGSADN